MLFLQLNTNEMISKEMKDFQNLNSVNELRSAIKPVIRSKVNAAKENKALIQTLDKKNMALIEKNMALIKKNMALIKKNERLQIDLVSINSD